MSEEDGKERDRNEEHAQGSERMENRKIQSEETQQRGRSGNDLGDYKTTEELSSFLCVGCLRKNSHRQRGNGNVRSKPILLSEAKVKDDQKNPARDDGYEFRLFSEEDVESQAFHQKLWTQDHNRGDECRRCERN